MEYLKKNSKTTMAIILGMLLAVACQPKMTDQKQEKMDDQAIKTLTGYEEDVSFLRQYTDIIELVDPTDGSKVALSAALQGRVMTSTAGDAGSSYGWINRALFESGDTSAHINVFGGEERFWLGPEGGQYSIFFKKDTEFNLDNWFTPRLIDLESFNVKSATAQKAVFTKTASLINYSGFTFDMGIERTVEVLSASDIATQLGLSNTDGVKAVGYQTTNILTNTGEVAWKKETGLLSIWLLGMFTPSPSTTVVLPLLSDSEGGTGVPVNIYKSFGEIPPERLMIKENIAFFKGDGQYRSKIGLLPTRAKDVAGAYDASSQTLTIVKYNKPQGVTDYVNSTWELQDEPYGGDVINSYNDGAPEPGKKPLGPFYELETSSPALALEAGESGTHIQMTYHFEGKEAQLDQVAKKVLGVSLEEIKQAF